ncbi:MAG: alternative ribosome rescue aminoacyl-tRNA hydrolase ArfB [Bacteroidetes bacterium]|nr:alternative ribosome rescue aminoacyl-tRNA hydrolase ArfB [Bacteroidota bacterium]
MHFNSIHLTEAIKLLMYRHFEHEYFFITSRSSGPGGQNVNKTETKVELRFNIQNSALLKNEEKELLLSRLKNKINAEGFLQIVVQESRSQLTNKQIAEENFYKLISNALKKKVIRQKSKPSLASVKRRLLTKKYVSKKKELRSGNNLNYNEME